MVAVAYPTSLPGPSPGGMKPRQRRAGSNIEGPLQLRARQRDFAGAVSEYPFNYSPAEMAIWREWYRTDLLDGRCWFAMPLPGRGGIVDRVVRYLKVVERLLPSGNYTLDATFEQRGVSAAPQSGHPGYWIINRTDEWRYLVVSTGDTTDYSDPEFDDSAWLVGDAPFADRVHPVVDGWPDPGTVILHNTSVWMRKTVVMTHLAQIDVTLKHDNSPYLWFNGVPVSTTAVGFVSTATVMPASLTQAVALRVDDLPFNADNYIYAALEAYLNAES